MHVLQHAAVGAAVAGAGHVLGAVEEHLHGGQEVAGGVVLHELQAVGDGGDGTVRPAGAAVLGDVLVQVSGAVVDAAHVAPGEVGGDVGAVDVVFGLGRGDDLLQRVPGGLEDFGVEEPVSGPQGGGCCAGRKGKKQRAKSSKAHVVNDGALC